MIFVTDDHRTVRLAKNNRPAQGVIPEVDDPVMRSLIMLPAQLKEHVVVNVDRKTTKANNGFDRCSINKRV